MSLRFSGSIIAGGNPDGYGFSSSTIKFYTGDVFPEWKGDLLICSLLGKSLIRLDFENNKIVGEEIIFKDKIGRIRDFEIDKKGNIYLVNDSSNAKLWKLSK